MKADFHIHSSFSPDSKSPMADMIARGLMLGLETMCFTEHLDYDFPEGEIIFEPDMNAYYEEYKRLCEQYNDQIELLFGIEIGLQPHLGARYHDFLASWPFDFVIGSSHVVNGRDPYYPDFFNGRDETKCYQEYFDSIVENLKVYSEMDVYGHIDYIVRYGPDKNKYYSYAKYREVLDEILRILVDKGIGLELNMSGFKYGLGQPNPHPDILKRYRQLGGEIITVGSDGHCPEHLAFEFAKVKNILSDCGIRYYTVYHGRKPEFIQI